MGSSFTGVPLKGVQEGILGSPTHTPRCRASTATREGWSRENRFCQTSSRTLGDPQRPVNGEDIRARGSIQGAVLRVQLIPRPGFAQKAKAWQRSSCLDTQTGRSSAACAQPTRATTPGERHPPVGAPPNLRNPRRLTRLVSSRSTIEALSIIGNWPPREGHRHAEHADRDPPRSRDPSALSVPKDASPTAFWTVSSDPALRATSPPPSCDALTPQKSGRVSPRSVWARTQINFPASSPARAESVTRPGRPSSRPRMA